MKLTDEERKELKELYNTYKDVKDVDSLKLLGGLIRTSKWYKNHKLTLNHRDSYIWNLYSSEYCALYTILSLKEILVDRCDSYTDENDFIIIDFLSRLIKYKYYQLYKPV
jgi:hypothetical protein